jgi:hypothetical protein
LESSIIFEWPWRTILDDYSLLLSIFQWNYITYENNSFLPCLNKVNDFELFLSDEIWDFLNESIINLRKIKNENNQLFQTIRRSLLLYYEAKFLLIYNENDILILMHLFEFLLWSICRIGKNIDDKKSVYLKESFSYMCKKFDYQKYINNKLHIEIKNNKLWNWKNIKQKINICDFSEQFNDMRKWIQHWKQQKKPELDNNSPSNLEFTFNYRLQSFIRLILSDLIYWKDFKRKFDILYQLILEKNVRFMPTPDLNKKDRAYF